MPKKPSKGRSDDLNLLARSIVGRVTGEEAPPEESEAAVRGRQGGLKGGKARADSLSEKERSEIARKAAEVRRKKNPPSRRR